MQSSLILQEEIWILLETSRLGRRNIRQIYLLLLILEAKYSNI